MKKPLIFGCVVALALIMMDFRQIVMTPAGFTVVKGGSALAADMRVPPPPPPPVGKGKAPVVGKGKGPAYGYGKGKAPIVTRG
jgi:hypothetical protein